MLPRPPLVRAIFSAFAIPATVVEVILPICSATALAFGLALSASTICARRSAESAFFPARTMFDSRAILPTADLLTPCSLATALAFGLALSAWII